MTLSADQFCRFDGMALPREGGDNVVVGQISKEVLGEEEPATPELSCHHLSAEQSSGQIRPHQARGADLP